MSPSANPTSQCVSVTLSFSLALLSPLFHWTIIVHPHLVVPTLPPSFLGRVLEGHFFSNLGSVSLSLEQCWSETSASSKRNGNELVHMLQESLARGLPELSNKCFMLREFCSGGRHYSITASRGNGVLIACLSGTLGLSFQCIVKFSPQFFGTAIINDIWQISSNCLNKCVFSYHHTG